MRWAVLVVLFLTLEPVITSVSDVQRITTQPRTSLERAALIGTQILLQTIMLDDATIVQSIGCTISNALFSFLSMMSFLIFVVNTRWYWTRQMVVVHLSDRELLKRETHRWGFLTVVSLLCFALVVSNCQRVSSMCQLVHDGGLIAAIACLVMSFWGSAIHQIDLVESTVAVLKGSPQPSPMAKEKTEDDIREPHLKEYQFRFEQPTDPKLVEDIAAAQKTEVANEQADEDEMILSQPPDPNKLKDIVMSSYVGSVLTERYFKDLWGVRWCRYSINAMFVLFTSAVSCTIIPGTDVTISSQSGCAAGSALSFIPDTQQYLCQVVPCPVNALSSSSASCVCQAGYIGTLTWTSDHWTGTCNACPVGTYTNAAGASVCSPCDANMSTSGMGMTQCVNCLPGQVAAAGAPCVDNCPDTSLVIYRVGSQVDCGCPVGSYGQVYTLNAAGTFVLSTQNSFTSCATCGTCTTTSVTTACTYASNTVC